MKIKFTLFCFLLFASVLSRAQFRYFAGVLQGSQAGTASIASGVEIVKYNMATRLLEHFGNYRGLQGSRTNQHIHTGAPGMAGPVTVPLSGTGTNFGTISGSATLTVAQEGDLLAGNMYTNIHSSVAGGGEIRAQLLPTTDGQTEFFNARLQGAQSSPPNGSSGNGFVNVLVDKTANMLYLTGSFSGLTTPAINAHIHTGEPNTNGAVIVPIIYSAETAGTLDTARTITNTLRDQLLSGNTYVNIHTTTQPAGEIRGQLTQLSQMVFLANALTGAQQVPPNASAARGTVIVKYNPVTNFLELKGDYQNLSNVISASHIHGPFGPAGTNTGVLVALTNTGGTTGTFAGTATLTELQEADLLAGNMYANIHSAGTYAGGEIRAQLLPTTMGETQYITSILQPGQSVSTTAVVSSGTGNATVLLDKGTNKVYVTGAFSGLTSNIVATHIHGGAAGTNGPVIVPLQFSGTTSGTVTGTATIRSTFADSIINGLSYLNIHTAIYGAGEIRSQLGNLVLPLKLTYFNAYKNGNKIALIWESAIESELKQYEVEQQDPATRNWVTKGILNATGGSIATKYRLDDAPLTGSDKYVIYRLKIVEKDGKVSYSQAVRINYLQSTVALNLLVNPISKGAVRFNITGLQNNKKAEVSIMDYSGRIMHHSVQSALSTNTIEVSNLAPGMYKLVVRVDGLLLQQTFLK